MDEIGDTADQENFLTICMGIEGLCAELYHYYSTLYDGISEASSLWKKTALEEENHQKQFELALHLLGEAEFTVTKDSIKHAYAVQYKLLELINHIKGTSPLLLAAVSNAIEMEEKIADLHVHSAVNFADVSLQKLFRSLYDADHEHIAALRRYQTILSLPFCKMG